MASIGYSVGVGNVWRFPYLCFKNGGGAYLIPYFILLTLGAIPMYYLEVMVGQYTRSGIIKVWDICPIFRGVGIGITIMTIFINIYFVTLMVWSMHFMFASLAPLFNEDGLLVSGTGEQALSLVLVVDWVYPNLKTRPESEVFSQTRKTRNQKI